MLTHRKLNPPQHPYIQGDIIAYSNKDSPQRGEGPGAAGTPTTPNTLLSLRRHDFTPKIAPTTPSHQPPAKPKSLHLAATRRQTEALGNQLRPSRHPVSFLEQLPESPQCRQCRRTHGQVLHGSFEPGRYLIAQRTHLTTPLTPVKMARP